MATLWAEARLGELLGGIDKKYVSSGKGTIEKLPSLPPGIDKKTSFIAQELGEMLKATERAKGKLKRGPVVPQGDHGEPTLSDLGLTKKHFSRRRNNSIFPVDGKIL